MKKLVFMFVAMAAMTLAMTTTSCKKAAKTADTTKADSAVVADSAVADSAAPAADSAKVDSLKK